MSWTPTGHHDVDDDGDDDALSCRASCAPVGKHTLVEQTVCLRAVGRNPCPAVAYFYGSNRSPSCFLMKILSEMLSDIHILVWSSF